MSMGTNIKMSLMPKGINKNIYNPGVSIAMEVGIDYRYNLYR
jgi:hypothetical protein